MYSDNTVFTETYNLERHFMNMDMDYILSTRSDKSKIHKYKFTVVHTVYV
jgi:hypothetical protein